MAPFSLFTGVVLERLSGNLGLAPPRGQEPRSLNCGVREESSDPEPCPLPARAMSVGPVRKPGLLPWSRNEAALLL